MKKQFITLSLASLLAGPTLTYVQKINASTEEDIILESPILHVFDGIVIDANVIEGIGFIRRKINKILIGEKAENGLMVGQYLIDGKLYSIKELMLLEENSSDSLRKDLALCLHTAKKDLQNCLAPFLDTIHSFKYQILELIKESCKKRGIENTLLLRWSEAAKGEEEKIFDKDVTSFKTYNKFCIDLLNFLMDLVNSCPKGKSQFKMRCDKYQKACALIKGIILARNNARQPVSTGLEQKFMNHFKENHIDKLTLTEITKEKLEALFIKFMNQKN